MTQQDVMKSWKDWMLSYGVSEQTADQILNNGYEWCTYLFDSVYKQSETQRTHG
jgi:hypothetical protein